MERAEPAVARQSEDLLLCTLTETIRDLEASVGPRGPRGKGADGGRRSGEESHEEEDRGAAGGGGAESRCVQKVLLALRELSISHTVRVAAWRDALAECAHMLAQRPPGGSNNQHQMTNGTDGF